MVFFVDNNGAPIVIFFAHQSNNNYTRPASSGVRFPILDLQLKSTKYSKLLPQLIFSNKVWNPWFDLGLLPSLMAFQSFRQIPKTINEWPCFVVSKQWKCLPISNNLFLLNVFVEWVHTRAFKRPRADFHQWIFVLPLLFLHR